MKQRITTYLSIKGKHKVVDLPDNTYGYWVIYEDKLPKYEINIFGEDIASKKIGMLISEQPSNKIDSIISNINKFHNRRLTLSNRPFFAIRISNKIEDLEIGGLPDYFLTTNDKKDLKNFDYYLDYSFNDWLKLDDNIKRDIINHYWDPFKPEIGLKTRLNIIDSFRHSIKSDLEYCDYRYFGFYASAIFVIVKDDKVKLPKEFAGLTINRGKIMQKLEDDSYIVKWIHSGKETIKLK